MGGAATDSAGRETNVQNAKRTAFPEERQRQIADLIEVNGHVRVSELVQRFGVTDATLRKDLTLLEGMGTLKRTHGGAVGPRHFVEPPLEDRVSANFEAKDAIARLCAQEVSPRDAVFLGSGTTVERIAHYISDSNVTVLTSSVGVARIVAERASIDHVLLGGRYRPLGGSLVGSVALDTLERFTFNVAFIGASGLTADGITVMDVEEGVLARAVIERSQRAVVPMDHTKIGTTHFAHVSSLDLVDVVVTDVATEGLEALCAQHDITLRVPKPDA